jgi:hypothetical protein
MCNKVKNLKLNTPNSKEKKYNRIVLKLKRKRDIIKKRHNPTSVLNLGNVCRVLNFENEADSCPGTPKSKIIKFSVNDKPPKLQRKKYKKKVNPFTSLLKKKDCCKTLKFD